MGIDAKIPCEAPKGRGKTGCAAGRETRKKIGNHLMESSASSQIGFAYTNKRWFI
jgi:hypothetical protein